MPDGRYMADGIQKTTDRLPPRRTMMYRGLRENLYVVDDHELWRESLIRRTETLLSLRLSHRKSIQIVDDEADI